MIHEATFFVSPQGDDHSDGTFQDPFATLEKAKLAVRQWASVHPGEGAIVLFREGTYRFAETVVFGLEDSAPSGATHVYAAYPDEKPIFSAGVKIPAQNWEKLSSNPDGLHEKARGNVWCAEVPDAVKSGAPILSLFEGTEFLQRAKGNGFALEPDPIGFDEELCRDTLNVPSEQLDEWADTENAEVVVIPKRQWTMNILQVESIDRKSGEVKTKHPHTYPMQPNNHIAESVWLENSLSVLNSPGQWVYDGNGKLYYWPRTGQPSDRIEYPVLTELIRVEGDIDYEGPVDTPVHGICFSGITFTHSDRMRWHGLSGWGVQHDWEAFDRPSAMVRFRGAQNCSINSCHFTCASSTGVRLDLHCRRNEITGNLFDELGCCAVLLCGYGPGLKDVNRGNVISNNHIHHIGLSFWHSPGIFIWQSGENTVAHNHIHHTGYTGIVVSGRMRWDRDGILECSRTVRWNETAKVVGENYQQQTWHQAWYPDWKRRNPLYHGHDNVLEYNDIHHVMQIMGDGNGIYISGTGARNVVRFNAIHDCPSETMAEGLRCDDDQHETTLHGNVIYNLGGFATGITIKGINTVTNNIIASGLPSKTKRGYISLEVGPLFGTEIKRNILCATNAAHVFYYQGPRIHGEGPLPLLRDCEADSNLYWCQEDPTRCNKHLSIERQFGIEQASKVADPLFVDPANGDFTLQPNSPARDLGFEEIDYSKIGPLETLRIEYR